MQLVGWCINILLHLHEESNRSGLNVNSLIKKTGSGNRPGILNAIAFLEEADIIEEFKDPQHKLGKKKKLTKMGLEIGDLLISINEYYKYFYLYNKKLHYVLSKDYKKIRKRKLDIENIERKDVYGLEIVRLEKDTISASSNTFLFLLTFKFIPFYLHTVITRNNNYQKIIDKLFELTLNYESQIRNIKNIEYNYNKQVDTVTDQVKETIRLIVENWLNTTLSFLPFYFSGYQIHSKLNEIRHETTILFDSLLSIFSSNEKFLAYYNKFKANNIR